MVDEKISHAIEMYDADKIGLIGKSQVLLYHIWRPSEEITYFIIKRVIGNKS